MKQLADRLPSGSIRLNSKATSISPSKQEITCLSSSSSSSSSTTTTTTYAYKYLVIATEAPSAAALLSNAEVSPPLEVPTARKSTCLYFSLSCPPPILSPVLVLNAENKLPSIAFEAAGVLDAKEIRINNLCFPSQVSSAYAPVGKSLASITVVGDVDGISDTELEEAVREELRGWWGREAIEDWKLLRIYRIPYAQPAQSFPYEAFSSTGLNPRRVVGDKIIYSCGDYVGSATLNGALGSGLNAAKAILDDMSTKSLVVV